MARIGNIETGHYRIPLPVTLSDSTHGEITHFELITVRCGMPTARKAWATPTPSGRGGATLDRCGASRAARRDADDRGDVAARCGGACTTAGAAAAVWRLGGRHRAVGPEGAPRQRRCGGCSAASIRACRVTPAASTSNSPLEALLRQTDDNLA